MTAVNNKMSPEIEHKLNESKHRFITLAEEIKSNVLIALSLPNCLQEYSTNYDYTKYKSIVDVYTKIEQNSETTLNEQKQFNSYSNFAFSNEDTIFEKSHLYNEFYHNFCKSLRAAIQDEVLVKMCKERCNQKITKQAKDISEAINTFLELICNKINLNFSDERIRENELILKYKENEAFKVQIDTIQQQIDDATEEYNKVSSDVTEKINYYKAQAESAVKSLKSKRTRFEMNYKNDMILYLKYFEKDLDELEAKLEAKKSQLKYSEVKNEIEIEHLKKEVEKKEILLQNQNVRYGNDMLNRYKKKKYLQQSIENKQKSYEELKEKVAWSETYLEQLDKEEKAYNQREFYDKLDAIREKIALRKIRKFLTPYIIARFGVRKKQKSSALKKKKKQNK